MSETQSPAEPIYGEPITKSDTSTPNNLSGTPPETPATPEVPPATPPAGDDKTKVDGKPDDPKPETPKQRGDWRDDRLRQQNARIAAEARRADAAERRLAEIEAKANTQQPAQPAARTEAQSPQDIEQMVQQRAEVVAHQRAFNAACNTVAEQGKKDFPDFAPTLQTLWDATDGLDGQGNLTPRAVAVIEAALETEKPHAVLHYLGQNPEEAIRIAALPSDAKRGAAVAKVAATLAASAATPKPISRAPAPLEPVNGGARAEPGPQGPKDTADWIKWREEQVKAAKR